MGCVRGDEVGESGGWDEMVRCFFGMNYQKSKSEKCTPEKHDGTSFFGMNYQKIKIRKCTPEKHDGTVAFFGMNYKKKKKTGPRNVRK